MTVLYRQVHFWVMLQWEICISERWGLHHRGLVCVGERYCTGNDVVLMSFSPPSHSPLLM